MAATELTVQDITNAGLVRDTDSDIFVAANADGNYFKNDGKTILIVKNGGAASRTVTIAKQKTSIKVAGYGNITLSNLTLIVDASGNQPEGFIQVPTAGYNDGNGRVQITYSSNADLTVCAFRISNNR